MSREGRAQPIQPVARHGFLGNTPANGVLPIPIVVVEPEDRRRQYRRRPPLDPIVQHGFLGNIPANGTLPPLPTNVPIYDERRRQRPALDPLEISGALSTVPPPVVTPPAPVNVDRADQRVRYKPLDPLTLSGALNTQTGAALDPPTPVVVEPADRRHRRYVTQQPEFASGFDDVTPPQPNVNEPARRRAIPLDPIVLTGSLAGATPQVVLPPSPTLVEPSDRRRLPTLEPTATSGFVDPGPAPVGTTPPPPTVLDRVDQRVRLERQQPIVSSSGTLAALVPAALVVVQAGTDWAAVMSTW